jgi:uncharacterized repeat protein (TIGR02543 family)
MRTQKIKRAIAILISLVLFVGVVAQPAQSQQTTPGFNPFIDYGDVNGDGIISAADVTMLRSYIAAQDKEAWLEENPFFNALNADANGDGFINAADVTLIRRWIAAVDKSTVRFGPQPAQAHTLDILNGLRFDGTVYEDGDIWYTVTSQETSAYEFLVFPDNLNAGVKVYDSDLAPIIPSFTETIHYEGEGEAVIYEDEGETVLYEGETYLIRINFADITSPQDYICIVTPRITRISEHWNYYGDLFEESPGKWIAITPAVDGEYNFDFEADDNSVSATIWEYTDGLTQLSPDSDGNIEMLWGMVYLIEVSTNADDFYCFPYILTLQLFDDGDDAYIEYPDDEDYNFVDTLDPDFEFDLYNPVDWLTDDDLIPDAIEYKNIVSAGLGHSLALKDDGTVWSWGLNDEGQLGDGTYASNPTPRRIAALDRVIDIDGGGEHSLALKDDGTVWAWGWNGGGQLGDGTPINSLTPKKVEGLEDIIAISAGGIHSLALQSDGSVWAWGWNGSGQIGDGTRDVCPRPKKIETLTNIIAISAGDFHSLALGENGRIWAWGDNKEGQLGIGSFSDSLVPQQISSITNATAISAGYLHSLAILANGTMRAWGHNVYGELGNGRERNWSNVPVAVHEITNAIAIEAGFWKSIAIESDGSVYEWGAILLEHAAFKPVWIDAPFDIDSISTAGAHSILIEGDGEVWTWGLNPYGQLGMPMNIYRVPYPLPTLPLLEISPNNLPIENLKYIEADELTIGELYRNKINIYLSQVIDLVELDNEKDCNCIADSDESLANYGRRVDFHPNGGSGSTIVHASCITTHKANFNGNKFTRTGYQQVGWSSNANGTGTRYMFRGGGATWLDFTVSLNWYAIWQAPIVTIKYKGNRNTGGTAPATQNVQVGYAPYSANTFTRTGMTFLRWNTKSNGTGTDYLPGEIIRVTKNTTLYAIWQGTITYTDEGADGGTVPGQTFIAGQKFTLRGNTGGVDGNLYKEGHDFAGWIRVSPGSAARFNPKREWAFQANVTFRPHWKPQRHTVTFESTLHTRGNAPNDQNFTYNKLFSLRGPGTLRRDGYRFAGWNTNANGTGTTYTRRVQFTGDITLYATWTPDMRTLRYSASGAKEGTAPPLQQFQRNLPLSYVPVSIQGNTGNLERFGWHFTSWRKGTTSYDEGDDATFNSNVTLHPRWERNTYTVTFSANGDTGTVPDQTYQFAKSFRLPTNSGVLQRANHTFNGWNTKEDGTGRRFKNGGIATLRGETVLYAQWKPVTYTIKYNKNNATKGSAPKSQKVQYPFAGTIQGSNNLERPGHEFVGWNTRADGYGTTYLPGANVLSSNVTLFAIFRPSEPNIVTYNPGGAPSTYAQQTYTPNVPFNLRNHVPWEHRTFLGWDTRQIGIGVRYTSGQSVTFMGGTVRLFAQWQVNRYTLTYDGNGYDGDGIPRARAYDAETSVTITGGNGMDRPGYDFLGWNTVRNPSAANPGVWYGGILSGLNRTIDLVRNTTLFAQWERTCAYKAIYILPGYLGSELYDNNGSGDKLWLDLLNNAGWWSTDRKDKFILDGFGNPGVLEVDRSRDIYGPHSIFSKAPYKDLVEELTATFDVSNGGEYDVLFWPYNWLGDLNDSVAKLEEHSRRYDDITFVTHSTGGLLAAAYINKSAVNKQRVNQSIMIAAPLFGTYASILPIERGDKRKVGPFDSEFWRNGDGIIDMLTQNSWVRAWAHNSPTTHQLLPSVEYLAHLPLQLQGVLTIPITNANSYYSALNGSDRMNNNLTDGTNRSHRHFRETTLGGDIISIFDGIDTLLIGTESGFSTPSVAIYNSSGGVSSFNDILYNMNGDGTVQGFSAKAQRVGDAVPILPYLNFTDIDHGELAKDTAVINVIINKIAGSFIMTSSAESFSLSADSVGISELVKIRYSADVAVDAVIYDSKGDIVARANGFEFSGFNGNDFIYDTFSDDVNTVEASIYMPNQGYRIVFSHSADADIPVDFTARVSTLLPDGWWDTSVIHTANTTSAGGIVAVLDGTSQAIQNDTISDLIDGDVIFHLSP